jgi:hypothetical protein
VSSILISSNIFQLTSIGLKVDHAAIKKITIKSIIAIVFFPSVMAMMSRFIYTFLLYNRIDFAYQFYTYAGTTTSIINASGYAMLICVIVQSVRVRFAKINESLRRKNNKMAVRTIVKMHLKLCEIVDLINDIFMLPLAIFLASNLTGLTISSFQLYERIISEHIDIDKVSSLVLTSSWNTYMYIVIMTVVVGCSKAAIEGEKCGNVLHQVLQDEVDGGEIKILRSFGQLISHKRPIFMCGLFEFNFGLISMVRKKFKFRIYNFFSSISVFWINVELFGGAHSVRCIDSLILSHVRIKSSKTVPLSTHFQFN